MAASRGEGAASTNPISEFLRLESAGGILLIIATMVAMLAANTPLSHWYQQFLDLPVSIRFGTFAIDKPLLLWINDGLMAIFFFLVGLELKREILEGELSKPSQVLLPLIGAIGGMVVPAAVYIGLNHDNPLMRIAADKVAVRDYLAWKGTAIRAPRLYTAGHSARELLEADLPDRFVLKSGSGWGQNLFVDGPQGPGRAALAAQVEDWLAWDHWRLLGELHYRGIPKRWLAEEIVGPPAAIVEYKFYCILGEPVFFLYLTDRAPGRFRCALFDMAWRPTPFHWARHPPSAERPRPPAAFEAMAADARRLAEDFLHVRVDFLLCGGQPYFSELTFSGGTRTVDVHVAQVRRKLGRPELVRTVRGAGYKAVRR